MDAQNLLIQKLGDDGVKQLIELLSGNLGNRGGARENSSPNQVPRVVPEASEVVAETKSAVESGAGSGVPVEFSGGGSDAFSWSDDAEAEAEAVSDVASSVVGVPPVSDAVRGSVSFGGFGTVTGGAGSKHVGSGGGLMAEFVRSPSAKAYKQLLLNINIKLPKSAAYDLAMVTHTAATMPAFFNNGKERLRSFAVLGDAALVCALVCAQMQKSAGVESLQALRTTKLTDGHMMRVFAASPFARNVTVAAGLSLGNSKTGATALEALVGVVAYYRSPADVVKLAKFFQLV